MVPLFSLPTEQDIEPHTTELLIPVTVAGYDLVGGFQFGVEWDPEVLSLTGIVPPEPPALPELNENNFEHLNCGCWSGSNSVWVLCISSIAEDPDPSNGEDPNQQEPVEMPEAAVALLPDSIVWDGVSEEIAVPLRVKNFDGISGVQFTLEWDASVLDLVTEVNGDSGATEVKVTTLQGVMASLTHPQFGVVEYLEPFFEGKHFNYPLTDLNSGDEIPGKATFLWTELDQPSLGRTVDDDDALFTIYFTVADSTAENTHVSIGDAPTPFKFAPGASGSVEAFTTPGLITIGEVDPRS